MCGILIYFEVHYSMSYFRIIPDKSDVAQNYNKPSNPKSWRYKLFEIIFQAHTPAGKIFDILLFIAILASVILIMFESIPKISAEYYLRFRLLDYFFIGLFTIEYILRIICVKNPKKYIFSFYGIVDLLAILPSYLEFIFPQSHMLMLVRSFRLLRIFRIFNMVDFLDESRLLLFSILRSFRKILIFLFFVVLLTIFLGSAMYVFEFEKNPSFSSIPQSIYWAIVTITTVGYGDISPITPLGKVFASFIMILGYAIIAVPTGILSSDFARSSARKNNRKKSHYYCEECLYEGNPDTAKFCMKCGHELTHDGYKKKEKPEEPPSDKK